MVAARSLHRQGVPRLVCRTLQLVKPFVVAPGGVLGCMLYHIAGGFCYLGSILLSPLSSLSWTKAWASALHLGQCVYLVITINNLVNVCLLYPSFKWLSMFVLPVFS